MNLNFLGDYREREDLDFAFDDSISAFSARPGSTFLALKKDIGQPSSLIQGRQARVAATSTVNGHLTNLYDSLSVRNLEAAAFWRCMNTAEAEDEDDSPGA
ncbi:uncharacterized protein LOC142619483 [Castanea sativa]|uniref:uncharacterized protein LOC142619483 n=1 Tax=Castanea sativa TaxID=21020 RepID=UPI003F64A603